MASKRISKKSISKISPGTAKRIVAISLQHPELGARRLVPLLKKKRIAVSAAAIQSILRREGLQNREKRMARLESRDKKTRKPQSSAKKTLKPKSVPKKPATRITDDAAERIIELSLQNPDFGATRLVPLLEKEKIFASASAVYRILKRRGLQTRERRLAKAAQAVAEPVLIPKTFPEKIPSEVEDRIARLSLQNPDFGARRLVPLLQREGIEVSASAVYRILKRNNLENRQKRLLRLEDRVTPEIPPELEAELPEPPAEPVEAEQPAPEAEVQEPAVEAAQTRPIPIVDEEPEPVFEPVFAAPLPTGDEIPAPVEEAEAAVAEPAQPERPHLRKTLITPIKQRSNWVFYPLYLLLLVLIGYLGFHAFQAIQYARLDAGTGTATESSVPGKFAKAEGGPAERPLDGYRQIWERNLFNTGKAGGSDTVNMIALEKIAPAKKDLGLKLVGTVVSDNPRLSRAIIDNRGIRKQEAYREGDTAGKVRIKKILRNNVVITTAEGDELLTVEIKETAKGAASYTGAQYVGSRSVPTLPANAGQRAPARTLSLKLKRDDVAASLADVDKFMEQLRIVPYKTGDQPAGFMIGSITPQNVLRKMGLRSRDVITAINDEAVTGPEQAAGFFERLSQGGEVTINFQRRRRDRQIRLNIE